MQSALYHVGMDHELDAARKAAFQRAALQDGVIDILIGLCLIGWGFLMEAGQAGLGGVLFATVYPTAVGLRKKLIEPRIGHVQLAGNTMRSRRLLLAGFFTFTMVAGVVVLLLSTGELGPDQAANQATGLREQLRSLGILVLGLPLTLVATVMGLVFGAARAHGYAVWILSAFLGVHLFARPDTVWAEPIPPLIISGLAPLAVGGFLLQRFLREHPVIEAPADFYDAA